MATGFGLLDPWSVPERALIGADLGNPDANS
jgi:hypothetical protein